jgi:hypothetical protein
MNPQNINSLNKRSPHSRGIPQPFNRPVLAVAQPRTATVQRKPVALAENIRRPVAPPVFRPQPMAINAHASLGEIQLKRGRKGGKGGFNYTSGSKHYSQDEIQKAQKQLNLKGGSKGHNKGNKNSGQSGQTINENRKTYVVLRENRAKAKSDKKNCGRYHRNDRNIGKICPYCMDRVD